MLIAWREFLIGKQKRVDVLEFNLYFIENICRLCDELKNNIYIHGGYEAFKINDPKPRDIHKAFVRDRLVHHLIYRALSTYFDRQFIFDSYSCRIDKGTHRAMDRYKNFGRIVPKNNTKTSFVLKCDIRKFFASIDHAILKKILAKHIPDKEILRLLERVIDSFNTEGKTNVGLPLGNLTSQLFVNIYMNEFDQWMKRVVKTKYYIRYADDFVILHADKDYLFRLTPKIAGFLIKN